MNPDKTVLILIGYQNDYFATDGILYKVIEESARANKVIENTLHLIEKLINTSVLIVSTPIFFSNDYQELVNPVGILQTIKEVGAFQANTKGAAMIPELQPFSDKIVEVPGKRGLNAFADTQLDRLLQKQEISNVVLAGAVTSICIDSTGRSAYERGYGVTILSDCTSAREIFEQGFYCDKIFPLYAKVIDSEQWFNTLEIEK